jgi:hypothetical protein
MSFYQNKNKQAKQNKKPRRKKLMEKKTVSFKVNTEEDKISLPNIYLKEF